MDHISKYLQTMWPSDAKRGELGSMQFMLWVGKIGGVPLYSLSKEPQKLKALIILNCIILSFTFGIAYTAFELYDVTLIWRDVNKLAQNASLMLTHVSGIVKVYNTVRCVSNIRAIIEEFQGVLKRYVKTKNQHEAFLHGELENKMFIVIYFTAVTTGILATVAVLQFNPRLVDEYQFPCRVTLPRWMPQLVKQLYIPASIAVMGYQNVSFDVLVVILINQLRTNLGILSLRIEELDEERLRPGGISHDRAYQHLRDVIQYHYHLLDIRNRIESLIRLPMVWQFFSSLVILAMTGFQGMQVGSSDIQGGTLITLFIYIICLVVQLFLFCCIGTMVCTKSISVAQRIGTSDWYDYDERYKKSLCIFLTCFEKPIIFTAGGVIELSLPTFLGILKMSYTYITVLQSFYYKI